jgi:2-(1,2-epoxy-1,2-dihydrophenyl)acetyl-CoA isomerase
LLGETLDSKTALSLGLVDFVVSDSAVHSEATRIAKELAEGPTEAFGAIKRLFYQTPDRSLESQLEEEAQTLAAISRTADAREGVKAFVEKRKPVFVGK